MSFFAAKFLFCLIAFILGTMIGSFLNVVIWRLPRGEKLSYPGSHCPKCNHKILPWENIPVISWIYLRGHCSNCHLPISWRYPAGELATGILYFWICLHILESNSAIECAAGAFWLAGALLAAAIIDAEHKFIPDKITYSGMAAAIVFALLLPDGRFALAEGNQSNVILVQIASRIYQWFHINLLANIQTAAITDCLLGAAVGFGILGCFAWLGKIITRPAGGMLKSPAPAVITQDGIEITGIWTAKWDDLITSNACVMTVIAEIQNGWKQVPKGTKGPLKISCDGLSINGIALSWDYVNKIGLRVSGWSCPKTVMGYGDLKLMTMIGAFLGADAAIYILFCASILGLFWGGYRVIYTGIANKNRLVPKLPVEVPFGPFLAIPSIVWLIFFA